ncbi:MAG TPA: VanZ family protein [Xanthomonadales bacterium]|nr:VanZ family protein [Xanthomonadales bacterium]
MNARSSARQHAESRLGAYRLWAAMGWAMLLGVVVLSLVSVEQPLQVQHADKLEHLLAYGMLMYWWGMVQPPRRVRWAAALALLGLALEWAQSLTAYRVMEWPDALANLAGVALALGLLKTPAGSLLARIDDQLCNRGDSRGA